MSLNSSQPPYGNTLTPEVAHAKGEGRRGPRTQLGTAFALGMMLALGCASSYEAPSAPSPDGRVASAVARLTASADAEQPCVEEARACYGAGGTCEVEVTAFVSCSDDAGCGGWEGIELTCAEVSCAPSYEALSLCYFEAEACRALDRCVAALTVEEPTSPAPDGGDDDESGGLCRAEAIACYGPSAPCGDTFAALLACSEGASCGTESIDVDCLLAECAEPFAAFETCYFETEVCRDLDVCASDGSAEPSEPVEPSEPATACEAEDAACTGEGSVCAATVDAVVECARAEGCEDEACLAQRCTDLYTDYTLCTFAEPVCRPAIDCRLDAGGPIDLCTAAQVACYFGGPCVDEYAAAYVGELGGGADEELLDALLACESAECPEVAAACGS